MADVLLPDRTNVNQRLVKEGWCGGSRNTRRTTVRLNNHSRKRNKQSEAYGVIPIQFHRGSIAGSIQELTRNLTCSLEQVRPPFFLAVVGILDLEPVRRLLVVLIRAVSPLRYNAFQVKLAVEAE